MKIKSEVLFVILTLTACTGPEGDIGPNGLKSLIKTTTIQSGTDCANGGVKIETGIDQNDNGILDASEIDNSAFVCNGQNGATGLTSLIKVTTEAPGPNCTTGGSKIETGLDSNRNNILDSGEITNTAYLCNGQDNFQTHVAIINQTGTNAPQSTIIKNTLDLNIVWTRTSQGKFKGTLNKSVDLTKTIILNNNIQVNCKFISSTEITLENSCGVNAFCDDFSNLTLEIKSFN